MHNKTVAGPFAFASPFGPIDTSKGPLATSGRALALKLAVERAPLSWQGEQLFALADKFVEYISGERAEEAKPTPRGVVPLGHTAVEAIKDSAGRIFVWDKYACIHREVVYK